MKSFALFLVLITLLPVAGRAEQYVRGNQVVHTRVAPVVVHRVFPPYRGQHVYAGRTVRR